MDKYDDEADIGGLRPVDDWRILPDLLPNGTINPTKVELRRRYYARRDIRQQVAAAVGWTPSTPEQERAAAIEYAALVAARCRQRTEKRDER